MVSGNSHAATSKISTKVKKSAPSGAGQNCKVKRTKPQGHYSNGSDEEEEVAVDESVSEDMQDLILHKLKWVNQWLDLVEGQITAGSSSHRGPRKDLGKLSRKIYNKITIR